MAIAARNFVSPCRVWSPSRTLLLGLLLDPICAKVAETGGRFAL